MSYHVKQHTAMRATFKTQKALSKATGISVQTLSAYFKHGGFHDLTAVIDQAIKEFKERK